MQDTMQTENVDFRPYLTAATSMDGSLSTTYQTGAQVVVCDNTLSLALRETTSKYRVKHTRNSNIKISEARDALKIMAATASEVSARIERLATTPVTTRQWTAFLDVYTAPSSNSARANSNAFDKRAQLARLYDSDHRVAPWAGTAWGVLSAANTWAHHYQAVRGTSRPERNLDRMVQGQYAKIDNHTWRQVLIDWHRMSEKPGKARAGLLFADADTQVIVLDTLHGVKKGTKHRLLVAGDKFPETVRDASALGAAKTAYDLGVEPGMSAEEMRDWADKLEHMDDIDSGEWLSRMRPLVDALTARTFLTETAAIMLLAGGFETLLPRELAIAAFRRAGGDDLRAAEEERAKTIRRKLRLTRKSTLAATALLTRVDPMSRELLATAAFDNNPVLVDAFVAGLPTCELAVPDQLMEKYLAEPWATSDEKIRILFQLLHPLKPKPQFSGWNGGMVASIALDMATNLSAQGFADDAEARKICSFLAHQLTTLKTATGKNISGNHTSLPLAGDINHIKDSRNYEYYWGYNLDAFRGLTEGHFDKIIADLGDETKSRPVGCYRDPRVSAPAVVAEVCQELGLSEPAAVYFLQLLTLVDPTDVNVKAWNKWKKKQLDDARAELIARDLVVEGKRTGAGRTVFLPGAWWEAQSGSMPVEAWKSNFYLIRYRERCESTVRWCPPTQPFDQLFPTVWGRWLSGDRPSFDALTTKKYRR